MSVRIDIYLALALGILGIIMVLVPPKNPIVIICLLAIAFGLSFYIVWTLPWIRDSFGRRLGGLLFVAACLCMFGDYVWPRVDQKQQPTAKQPTAEEIAAEVVKRIPGLSPESQKLEPTTFKEKVEKVMVSFGGGGISTGFPLSSLQQGGAIEPYNLGGYKPIRLYLDQGRLFADVSIYGGPGKPPIEVKHNDFIVRVPGWDRNFDSTALEVVNNTNAPVFQLIYRTPYQIVINGIFPSPAGLMLASEDGFQMSMPFIPRSFRILRLFKYPSNQFPGQREEARHIIPRPKLKEQAINLSEELFNFANEREKMHINAIQKGKDDGKIGSETAVLYDEQFALKCSDIAEEIAASGINVGGLPSLCRGANNTIVMRQVASQLKVLAMLLP